MRKAAAKGRSWFDGAGLCIAIGAVAPGVAGEELQDLEGEASAVGANGARES